MIFDIVTLIALLVLVASHIYLAFRKRENIDFDHFWLSLNVAIKKLEDKLHSINQETKLQTEKLNNRLEIHDTIVGDMGRQMIQLENSINRKFEKFSELSVQKTKEFEAFNRALQSNIHDFSRDLEDAMDKIDKDIQKFRVESDRQVKESCASLSQAIDTKIVSKEKEAIALVDETKRSIEDRIDKEHSSLAENSSNGLSDLDSRLSEKLGSLDGKLESSISKFGSQLATNIKNLDSLIEKTAADCGSKVTNIAHEIDKDLSKLIKHGKQLESDHEEQGKRIASIQDDLVHAKRKEEFFDRHVQRQNQITKNIENLVNSNNAFNYNTFKAFDRRFLRTDYDESLKPIIDSFGLSISFNTAGYLAHKICKIEETCVGRLATNIQDALIRLVCVFGLKNKDARILEIGTLFGINLCIVEELSSAYGKNLTYQVIDPLYGYYKSGHLDIVTKQKIDSRNFWFNIKKCGLDSDKFKLIEGFSHHKSVKNQIRDGSIDLAFIDGDHTKKGVALDIRNYHPKLRKGGYFLFDDYDSKQWPDVKEAVDASRIIKTQYNFVGHAFRTAIYSKK